MKTINHIIISIIILVLPCTNLISQDQRTLDTKVADLLVQVPADNQKELNRQMNLMLELGEEGLQIILDMIIAPGTGDDTNPRDAIESLSRYLGKSGKEIEKENWENMLLQEIDERIDTEVKSFLISQLNYISSDATVAGLSKYLTDDKLHDPAIRAIRDANPEAAAKVFAENLKKTSGNTQIALVNAIGETGMTGYATLIASLYDEGDKSLQKSVLASLSKLGDPESYKLLMEAAKEADFKPEATNATLSLLAFAGTLSEKEIHNTSLKICKVLLKKCTGSDQIAFRTSALLRAAGNHDIDESVALLTTAMSSESKRYRMAAVNYAAEENSPVDPWISTLNKSKSDEVKTEILYLFGLLRSNDATISLKSYLKDENSNLRQQALKSIVAIEKSDAIKDVIDYAISFSSDSDLAVAKAAALQIVDEDNVQLLINEVDTAPLGAKVVFLEVIAAKGFPENFHVLFGLIDSEGHVRNAALSNLYRVTACENLDDLLNLFISLNDTEERKAINKAIVRAVNDCESRLEATKKLLTYVSENSSIEKFIGVLAGVGGEDALNAVYSQYVSGDEKSKTEAFNALIKSSDIAASGALFKICSDNLSSAEKELAFQNYIRLISSSNLTDDQKLLKLRMVDPFTPNQKSRLQLLRAAGNVKTFLGFIYVSKYLDDKDLKFTAARALVKIVLPSPGKNDGLSGEIVRENLLKASEIIAGPESEYIKIDIENYIKEMPDIKGYESMFNGTDLSGWQGLAANPKQKKKLSEGELKKLQTEANSKMLENWSVKDNSIVFNGKGANLCSIKEYGSFEMIVDWRITKKGDSGIYLRGTPQVQIWDTSRVEVGAEVGSGGLYNNKINESNPLLVADNPIGEWNTFHITMIGNRVTVYLNGQLVVDNVIMENYWDRGIPIFPTGPIELQAHGSDLAFRDLYINELKKVGYNLSDEEIVDGFVSLFNGEDLSGWKGENHNYLVEDGTIVIRPSGSGGNLYTEKEYSDFIYRFDFKLTPGANNGLGIRTPLKGNAAYVGFELQILDNTAPVFARLEPYQYHGSVYGIIPAKRGFLSPVGEWNSQEVILKGDDIKITLNGTVILDGNIKEATKDGSVDGKNHPGLNQTKGHIGFLGHGSLVWFRNIRIKEL